MGNENKKDIRDKDKERDIKDKHIRDKGISNNNDKIYQTKRKPKRL